MSGKRDTRRARRTLRDQVRGELAMNAIQLIRQAIYYDGPHSRVTVGTLDRIAAILAEYDRFNDP